MSARRRVESEREGGSSVLLQGQQRNEVNKITNRLEPPISRGHDVFLDRRVSGIRRKPAGHDALVKRSYPTIAVVSITRCGEARKDINRLEGPMGPLRLKVPYIVI